MSIQNLGQAMVNQVGGQVQAVQKDGQGSANTAVSGFHDKSPRLGILIVRKS
ncbi:hypothetical protein [Arthrobacter methylotrophus]|uniref:hypothetical protein n=1 Tax=Arthrobacter methylotrophus TaxID=121291 RepID=UPI0031EF414D